MHRSSLAVSAIALLSATQAAAQATGPLDIGTIVLGSDATAAEALEGDDPAAGGADIGIENKDLTRINPSDLQDVFKSQPSIQVGSSLPISQKIYVNGVEENNLNVTIDGARQNNRIFHHSATTYVDPELLKAVRVDPGVAPADAGPGAVAGAIAFETKDVDDLLLPGRDVGGRVSSEYQSNGDTWTNTLGVYGRNDGFEYLLFGKAANGDDREDGSGTTVPGSTTALRSGLAKLAYTGADGSRIEFSYESVEDDADRNARADFAGMRGVYDERRWRLRRQNVVLTFTGGNTSEFWDPTFQLAYNRNEIETGPWSRDPGTSLGETTSLTGKAQNRFSLANGTITAGLDFYMDEVNYAEKGNPAAYREETANNIGLFAQGRFDLTDRARLSAGLRYDYQTFTGTDGTDYANGGFSANLAGDYDVTDAVTISAGASRVWGGIALAESYLFFRDWDYPDSIEPVTSDNAFIAATAELGSGFSIKAKLFGSNIHNARTLFDGPASESFGLDAGDTSDLETRGFEIGAGYTWGAGFARIAYAEVDAEIDGVEADSYTGRYLTTPIGNTIVLEAAHRFDNIGLTIGADAQHTMGQEIEYLGAPSGETDDYTVVNAFAEWTPRRVDGLTIRAGVTNLFDEQYADSATYGQEFGTIDPLYEPGRSVTLKATYRF